jgi:hypothetical protein
MSLHSSSFKTRSQIIRQPQQHQAFLNIIKERTDIMEQLIRLADNINKKPPSPTPETSGPKKPLN